MCTSLPSKSPLDSDWTQKIKPFLSIETAPLHLPHNANWLAAFQFNPTNTIDLSMWRNKKWSNICVDFHNEQAKKYQNLDFSLAERLSAWTDYASSTTNCIPTCMDWWKLLL